MPVLSWLTRERDLKAADSVPYRLLSRNGDFSIADADNPNMLIHGDNLEALKSLLPYHRGQVKCVYIDPPFNTGEAFPDYDDNLEHSIWLGMMQPRLALLHDLLAEDGTLVLHLDDNEIAYATVLLDEIFGRKNRTYQVTFKQSAPKGHKTINPGLVTIANYIVIYAKDKSKWQPGRGFAARPRDKRYASYVENFDGDMQTWKLSTVSKAFLSHHGYRTLGDAKKVLGKLYDETLDRFVMSNAERVVQPVTPDYSQVGKDTQDLIDYSILHPQKIFEQDRGDDLLPIILQDGKRWLFYKNKLRLIDGAYTTGEALSNIWDDLLSNNLHNEGNVKFPKGKKPEALVKRVFDLFSKPGDLVMDSFLGSGTTVAVAHKMGRRWIGIEEMDQAKTHCYPRLKAVVEGEQGGISKAVGWSGGGGFGFYELAEPVFDADGTITPTITFGSLATHIWFSETGQPPSGSLDSPFLGASGGSGIALLYNGILGDRAQANGNVLTRETLSVIRKASGDFSGPLTIYGEATRLSAATMKSNMITFKQTPYDVRAR